MGIKIEQYRYTMNTIQTHLLLLHELLTYKEDRAIYSHAYSSREVLSLTC